jgi:hypothetical protein
MGPLAPMPQKSKTSLAMGQYISPLITLKPIWRDPHFIHEN